MKKYFVLKKNAPHGAQEDKTKTSSIRTVTVGFGISPNQLSLADYTAGEEFHLAPKIGCCASLSIL